MIKYIYNHKYYRNVVILLGGCLTVKNYWNLQPHSIYKLSNDVYFFVIFCNGPFLITILIFV